MPLHIAIRVVSTLNIPIISLKYPNWVRFRFIEKGASFHSLFYKIVLNACSFEKSLFSEIPKQLNLYNNNHKVTEAFGEGCLKAGV